MSISLHKAIIVIGTPHCETSKKPRFNEGFVIKLLIIRGKQFYVNIFCPLHGRVCFVICSHRTGMDKKDLVLKGE